MDFKIETPHNKKMSTNILKSRGFDFYFSPESSAEFVDVIEEEFLKTSYPISDRPVEHVAYEKDDNGALSLDENGNPKPIKRYTYESIPFDPESFDWEDNYTDPREDGWVFQSAIKSVADRNRWTCHWKRNVTKCVLKNAYNDDLLQLVKSNADIAFQINTLTAVIMLYFPSALSHVWYGDKQYNGD